MTMVKLGERCRRCGKKIRGKDGVSEIPRVGGSLAWYHVRCYDHVLARRRTEGHDAPGPT